MITVDIVLISLFMSVGLGMGLFSVTQLGYQKRQGGLKLFYKSIWAFLVGFVAWPIMFPIGMMEKKYKMNVFHKIGRPNFED